MLSLLDIQRMSSEDGPGLRTTAFLKGCSLSCAWCHNPESISSKGEVLWHKSRCIGCLSCSAACPNEGIKEEEGHPVFDRSACPACFTCASKCPTGAIEAKGTPIEVDELVRELLKDRSYFGIDGGVTVSGGEALFQPESIELLQALKEAGVEIAVDTCGQVSPERLLAALGLTDIMLFDLKFADDDLHRRWTGAGNKLILENLELVAQWAAGRLEDDGASDSIAAENARLWIRTPIIPGATDSDENIRTIARILRDLPGSPDIIERWELCAFNKLCTSKYASLDRAWEFASAELIADGLMQAFVELAQAESGIKDVRATGETI